MCLFSLRHFGVPPVFDLDSWSSLVHFAEAFRELAKEIISDGNDAFPTSGYRSSVLVYITSPRYMKRNCVPCPLRLLRSVIPTSVLWL